MNAFRLVVQPFEVYQITEFYVHKEVNKHIVMFLKGYILKEDAEILQRRQMFHQEIVVDLQEAGKKTETLFCGIIMDLGLCTDGDLYEVEVTSLSYSCLLDEKERFRTFQREGQIYSEIAKEVAAGGGAAIICNCGDTLVGPLEIQYRETDWEFLKRMASKEHSILISDCRLHKPAIYFGMKVGKRKEVIVRSKKVSDRMEDGRICREYELNAYGFVEIGDKLLFNDTEMQVYGVEIRLENQELISIVRLRKQQDHIKNPYYNFRIPGVSLYGTVKEVINEKLQIVLDGDEGKQTGQRWFDFATVYSSPEGSGWYCMPEIGDSIYLYSPNERPEDAYVLNAVHLEGAKDRKDPEHKYLKTKRDQEIRFSPGRIIITNNKGMKIVLDDEKGIEIKSDKDILLEAEEGISINSGQNILAKGNDAVILKQSINMIAVRNGIREHGIRIDRQ